MCEMVVGADPATLCSSKEAVPQGAGAMGLDGIASPFGIPCPHSAPLLPGPLPYLPPGFGAAFAWGVPAVAAPMRGRGRQRGTTVKPVHASTTPAGSQ